MSTKNYKKSSSKPKTKTKRRKNTSSSSLNKKKLTICLAVLLALIFGTISLLNMISRQNRVRAYTEEKENTQFDCTNLEKIAICDFVKDKNISVFSNDQYVKDNKVKFLLSEYFKTNPVTVNSNDANKMYYNLFSGDMDKKYVTDKIDSMLQEGQNIDSAKQQANENILAYKQVTKIESFELNEFVVTIDIVKTINVDAMKQYCKENNITVTNEELTADNQNLLKYLNAYNYKNLAGEVSQMKLSVRANENTLKIFNVSK